MIDEKTKTNLNEICECLCNHPEQQLLAAQDGRVLIVCANPNHEPYYVNPDGTTETIE